MSANGERERIARIRALAPEAGGRLLRATGDDAAVVRTPDGVSVTSVDAVVDGVHFERGLFANDEIGYKAVAGGVSDLAAMGASPGEVYVAMGLPDDVDATAFDELRDGVVAATEDFGALLAGGDLTASPVLWISVTAVGYASGDRRPVGRDGARPGDLVVVTGSLGGAAAALLAMRQDIAGLDDGVRDRLRQRQTRPQPRLAAGQALAAIGATAMIDVSDGIAKDADEIAAASGVAIDIRLDALPIEPGVAEVAAATGTDVWRLVAGCGEDYELLATLPPAAAQPNALADITDGQPTIVGVVREGTGLRLLAPDGAAVELRGYEHFG